MQLRFRICKYLYISTTISRGQAGQGGPVQRGQGRGSAAQPRPRAAEKHRTGNIEEFDFVMFPAAVSPRQEATTDHRQQRGVDEAEAAPVHGEPRAPEAAVVMPPQRRGEVVSGAELQHHAVLNVVNLEAHVKAPPLLVPGHLPRLY